MTRDARINEGFPPVNAIRIIVFFHRDGENRNLATLHPETLP